MLDVDARVRIGVLTSGGDAPGMNPAVRAVVRAGIDAGAEVFAIREGWQGAVDGGAGIRSMGWEDVSGILHRGGTVIGTARSEEFRSREGRRTAVRHLLQHGIDRLVVIGGDGSMAGAAELRGEWQDLVHELTEAGEVTPEVAEAHPALMIAGLVGSIDNDMIGTDMTIGADSALHRITDAIDAVSSTAASHQRAFIVRVMGRRCGYLALMSALAGGADYALAPEMPPVDDWPDQMCRVIRRSRAAGRRDTIIVLAEGAQDRQGNPITTEQIREILRDRLGQDARVTDLGHVQRGGSPNAYDRWMSTLVGVAAVDALIVATPQTEPVMIGMHRNEVVTRDLMEAVRLTRSVGGMMDSGGHDEVVKLRGRGFADARRVFLAISEANPTVLPVGAAKRIAIVHAGALAPGMNTAAWAAVRLGIDRGHTMLGIRGGFRGLAAGDVVPLTWGDVDGWASSGGAGLGTRRQPVEVDGLDHIGHAIAEHRIDALLVIGGFDAYVAIDLICRHRRDHPALDIPIAVLPASIDNNLPGARMSIGADSALGVAMESLDRLKHSASANRRAFVAETMGHRCGFLALAAGIASGAERVYLPEEPITLAGLERDTHRMREAFRGGRRFYLVVRNEEADPDYTTDFLAQLFGAAGRDLFDVRRLVLGHVQQGPNPSPFDRMNAIRFAECGIDWLSAQLADGSREVAFSTDSHPDGMRMTPFAGFVDMIDLSNRRPVDQWWLAPLRDAAARVNERTVPATAAR